jgi:hypothetical protein
MLDLAPITVLAKPVPAAAVKRKELGVHIGLQFFMCS